jgi:hypothetical protein
MSTPLREAVVAQGTLNDRYARLYGLGTFLDAVTINSAPEPRPFGEVADPWQRQLVAPKIAAVNALAGFGEYTGPRRFLDILPRGHDKSSLEGRIVNFSLTYSRRPITGYIIAADKDQGRLIVEAAQAEAKLNSWFGDKLEYGKYSITGPAGKVEVVPADAGSAFGFTGNLYIMDEVTHWKDGIGKKIYETIASGLHKVPGTVVVAIMNAWVRGSWQEELLIQPAMAAPKIWTTFYRQGTLASWLTPEDLDGIRQLLPRAQALRVIDNVPIDPTVEAGYLDPRDAAQCVRLVLDSHDARRPGYRYVVSVDYGPTKDRTVLVVMHLDELEQVVIDKMDVWEGKNFPTGRVDIDKIEEWIGEQDKLYKPDAFVFDPYEMEGTIQRWVKRGRNVVPFKSRAGQGNMDLAMTLRGLIANKRLLWKESHGYIPNAKDDTFYKELVALVTRVMVYGWRLDHEANKHDDRAVAVGMGAISALEFRYVKPEKAGGEVIVARAAAPPYGRPAQPWQTNPLMGR